MDHSEWHVKLVNLKLLLAEYKVAEVGCAEVKYRIAVEEIKQSGTLKRTLKVNFSPVKQRFVLSVIFRLLITIHALPDDRS